jgi:hypothetical protein
MKKFNNAMIPYSKIYLPLLYIFINKLSFILIRSKLETVLMMASLLLKKYYNLNLWFCFFESILKLKPIIGAYIFIIQRKGKKKIRHIYPYLLHKENRNKKALSWLIISLKLRKSLNIIGKLIEEISFLSLFNKSQALNYKKKYYSNIFIYKIGKNYLW